MFRRILKKDMKHRRGINTILFMFMIMATVFVASSVNNILVVTNATQYCMEKGNMSDLYLIATPTSDTDRMPDDWLSQNKLVETYSTNESISLAPNNVTSYGDKTKDFNSPTIIALQSQWDEHMLLFNQERELAKVSKGEIMLPQKTMDANNLKEGDSVKFETNNRSYTFKISGILQDPIFGGDMISLVRFLISDEDFQEMKADGAPVTYNYNIETNDMEAFEQALNKESFHLTTQLDRSMFEMSYVMSMLTAGVLIIVGLCLIIIAFLILRFTIIFTLQEDYREIGIMKAIGIKERMIKQIYLVKYFVMILVAASIGCVLSIPAGNMMLEVVVKQMMLESAAANYGVNILCSVAVGAVVLILCYLCTNRLRKFTAIEAIRNGQTGERYRRLSFLQLHQAKRLPTVWFMAWNDTFSSIKKYIALLLIFIIGTILIVLPLNIICSLTSDEMISNFAIDTNSSWFLPERLNGDGNTVHSHEGIAENFADIKNDFSKKGYDIDLSTLIFHSLTVYGRDKDNMKNMMILEPYHTDGSFIRITEGEFPSRADEIAVSQKAMEQLDVQIGDKLYVKTNDETRCMIITGTYSNFLQLGVNAITAESSVLKDTPVSGHWIQQCFLKNKTMTPELLAEVQKALPHYEILSGSGVLDHQLGDITSQLDTVKYMILLLIGAVNVLITLLMMKIFILGEKGQIAMLRSIGFSLHDVRIWHASRIGIILALGVVLGVLASIPLNTVVLKPIFGMMGATNMEIQVNPLEAYLICPGLLFILTTITAYLTAGSIRKMNLMEINNID